MTLPNKITIGRICCIPVFVILAVFYGRSVAQGVPQEWLRWAAVAVFGLAAASDGLDGYIARRYNQVSPLGVVLDPIADKGLLFAGIITLSMSHWEYELPLWFPILVISRDIIVMGGAVALHSALGGLRVKPTFMGKFATVAQMVAIGAVLLWPHLPWRIQVLGLDVRALDVPVFVAGFCTLISGLGYVRRALLQLHQANGGGVDKTGEP
jgi:CDP-diacylglycerol--glycerol-3-phosphate 3-phosphatidyltransferase